MKYPNKITKLFLISFLLLSFLFAGCNKSTKVIGTVSGAEHEYITIGDDTYTVCNNPGVTVNERNTKLGKVVFQNPDTDPMIVWSINGYDDLEYIYTLWVYDGAYYKKDTK